jgi:hypothetical protein
VKCRAFFTFSVLLATFASSRAEAHVPDPVELITKIPEHRLTLGPEVSVGFLHYKGITSSGATIGARLDVPWRDHFGLYLGAGIGIGALFMKEERVKAAASLKVHGGVSMIFDRWPGGFDFGMYWVGENLSGGASPQGSAFGLEIAGYYPFMDGRGRITFALLPGLGTGRELDVSTEGNIITVGFREFLLPAMGAQFGISYRF